MYLLDTSFVVALTAFSLNFLDDVSSAMSRTLEVRKALILSDYDSLYSICDQSLGDKSAQNKVVISVKSAGSKVNYCKRRDVARRSRWWTIETEIPLPQIWSLRVPLFKVQVFKNTL